MSVMLSGSDLSVTDVVRVARGGERVELDPEARDRMDSARAVVEAALHSGEPVYGLTTGVAERKRVLLNPEDRRSFNVRLVHSHRIAQGAPAPAEGIEDRTTNAPLSARRLAEMVGLTARVAAIELVVAAQAIDLRRAAGNTANADLCLGAGTDRAYRMVRELVPFIHAGDTLPPDLEPVVGLVTRGDPASELELPLDQ